DKNCPQIKDAFIKAFISKDPCKSTEQDYKELMDLTSQTIPCNKSILWSKSEELTKLYSHAYPELFMLEDTLMGYIADNLTWCGDEGSSEINSQSCPDWTYECTNNTMYVFWKTVSKRVGTKSEILELGNHGMKRSSSQWLV
ncbi:PREDICTED: ADP-ribosyl cyclase/cyclic ADP-ribose hydrolase 1-like, partial [Miniopterus natalensis]|uniref:ADP-ribosyl cyclase/cyclic ADP-ribose hydrolase 1-like n=1 Tax=Miniopterus natalensis TaxID=291302 RepID=UPI0007A6AEF6